MTTAVQSRRISLRATPRVMSVLTFSALWVVVGWLVWHRVALPGDVLSFHSFSMVDFRDSVWIAVHDFVHGGIPWDSKPFVHRHPEAQFFPIYLPSYFYAAAPLLLVRYQLFATLWVGLLLAALVWMVHRCLALWAPGALAAWPVLVPLATGVALLTRPVQTAVSQGNFAVLCAAGAMLAITAPRPAPTASQWQRLADPAVWGVVVALVKPPVGLGLVLVLVCSRRTGTALRGLAVTVALGLPVAFVVVRRAGGILPAARLLLRSVDAGDGATPGYAHYTRIDAVATLGRIIHHPPLAADVLLLAAVVALAGWTVATASRRFGLLDARTLTAAGLTIVLVTPNLHYAMIALLPAVVALTAAVTRAEPRDRRWAVAVLLLLLVPIISPVRGSVVLGLSPQGANLVYALCLLVGLAVVATWTRRSSRQRASHGLSLTA